MRQVALAFCVLAVFGLGLAQDKKPDAPSPITKPAIQQRLQYLQAGREQALANLNAFNGAIQECQYWLGQIDAAEKAAAEKPKPDPGPSDAQPAEPKPKEMAPIDPTPAKAAKAKLPQRK